MKFRVEEEQVVAYGIDWGPRYNIVREDDDRHIEGFLNEDEAREACTRMNERYKDA